MEKVTFPPLIELLRENAESLNMILRSRSAVSRRLNPAAVPDWFKSVIEPVFTSIHKFDKSLSRKIFDVLFRDMLNVLSGSTIDGNFELVKSVRLLLGINPAVTSPYFSRVLTAFSTALPRICRLSSEKAERWLKLLQQIIPLVKGSDELLEAGRIAAWRCGMAHLRERIDFAKIFDRRILVIIFPDEQCEINQLKSRWKKDGSISSLSSGKFSGLGGEFSCPPKLATKGRLIFASDGNRTWALFADRFGNVFQECNASFKPPSALSLNPIKNAKPKVAKLLAKYKDLTTWVYHDSTLYLTTSSSHSVFVFGSIND